MIAPTCGDPLADRHDLSNDGLCEHCRAQIDAQGEAELTNTSEVPE